MRNMLLKSALTLVATVVLASCASQPRYATSHDRDYDRNERRHDDRYDDRGDNDGRYRNERCDTCGTISSIEPVWIDDSRSGGGTVLGAIIGGALGNTVGSGDGRKAATVAGAVAGGVIGHQLEKNQRDQRRGLRIEVRLDDGRYGTVTQLERADLDVGDRVIIRDDRVYILR